MNKEQDHINNIAEIRSMMERSSKFLSLSGLAGVMAGIYALAGAYFAYSAFGFSPDQIHYSVPELNSIILIAVSVLVLAIGTAVILSARNAKGKEEKAWNTTSRRLLVNVSVPLFTGGILILMLLSNGLTGLAAPFTLIFYGLTLYNAGSFTFNDVKSLGLIQIVLGLLGAYFIEYSLVCWALGFGVAHIVYGLYIHFRYER